MAIVTIVDLPKNQTIWPNTKYYLNMYHINDNKIKQEAICNKGYSKRVDLNVFVSAATNTYAARSNM